MQLTKEIIRQNLQSEYCKRDLLEFTKHFYKCNNSRSFVVGEHHKIICNALQKVIEGKTTRLIINIAPRYGKTEVAVKNFISYGLALNPKAKFIHLSYSDTLALDNSGEVKDIVIGDEYQRLYPHIKIRKDSRAKNKWYTEQGGGVYATSSAGQVTGFGAGIVDEDDADFKDIKSSNGLFGGAIIIDDPIKPEDAESPTLREKINSRFDSTIRNRVNSRKTPIIVIMQRVHANDLCGHLMEKEEGVWEVISLPAINDINNKYGLEPNKPLWEFKHTLDELISLKNIDDVVFERQYMQNPMPKEGLLFNKDEIKYYDPNKINLTELAEYKFAFIDPADTGDALCMGVAYLVENRIYITDFIHNNNGAEINEVECLELIKKHKLNRCNIEGIGGWRIFGNNVRNKAVELGLQTEIIIVKSTTNKITRINVNSAFVKNNMLFSSEFELKKEYKSAIRNITNYVRVIDGVDSNKHDDAVDTITYIAEHFRKNFSHLW